MKVVPQDDIGVEIIRKVPFKSYYKHIKGFKENNG